MEKIGFIGQGWIGKNYADDFEHRGYKVIRYALEPEFIGNRHLIQDCSITFIAVPTPTTPQGFDASILREALKVIGTDNVAVIKSTLLPGTTVKLQEEFPDIIVLHSPEFLVEKTAAHDAANPKRNIAGIPKDTPEHRAAAETLLSMLPEAPYEAIMTATEAELVKYAGNGFLYTKVLFMNMLYDLVSESGGSWDTVREAMINDPRIGESHTQPVHASGRGAGGHCFIKDYEALRHHYKEVVGADEAFNMMTAQVIYNNYLLRSTHKDLDLLEGVYGKSAVDTIVID